MTFKQEVSQRVGKFETEPNELVEFFEEHGCVGNIDVYRVSGLNFSMGTTVYRSVVLGVAPVALTAPVETITRLCQADCDVCGVVCHYGIKIHRVSDKYAITKFFKFEPKVLIGRVFTINNGDTLAVKEFFKSSIGFRKIK